jgi:hypothetical protein
MSYKLERRNMRILFYYWFFVFDPLLVPVYGIKEIAIIAGGLFVQVFVLSHPDSSVFDNVFWVGFCYLDSFLPFEFTCDCSHILGGQFDSVKCLIA